MSLSQGFFFLPVGGEVRFIFKFVSTKGADMYEVPFKKNQNIYRR
jgi:hypothetical protein